MEIRLKFNRNFNDIPITEIENSVEILMKYQWKSIGNPVEIQYKLRRNFNEIPMEISWKSI